MATRHLKSSETPTPSTPPGAPGERPRADGRKTRSERTESLVETVRRLILEDIVTGRLEPGSVIRLAGLAEQYGVSRTPAREALAVLEREGLVTAIAYKGYLVRPIDPHDVQDVYAMRQLIEGAGAAAAAGRITGEALDRLASLRPPQVSKMTLDYDEYAHDFHREIIKAAGSPRLLSIFESLYNDIRRLQYSGIGNPRPDLIHAEHQQILDALRRRDAEAAQRRMEEHIDAIKRRAMEVWLGGP